MNSTFPIRRSRAGGLSLVEILTVVAIIGIIAAVALPMVSDINPAARIAKSRGNAQKVAKISSTLAGMGVAHVIPQSMGGVEATVRLLREGVTVTHELFEESIYRIPDISDQEVEDTADYLRIVYDTEELRLVYVAEADPPVAMMMIW